MSYAMPRARVGIYLDEDIFQALQALADSETRTVPNLIEHLIIEALRSRAIVKPPEMPTIEGVLDIESK